eukprot:GHVU01055641.1.p1 GENE.GHVU01055641.1~~GHVU01055641.1.p1  ORF type:complete len:102 (+),score=20.16 GHVU01055641.1:179-484(+)
MYVLCPTTTTVCLLSRACVHTCMSAMKEEKKLSVRFADDPTTAAAAAAVGSATASLERVARAHVWRWDFKEGGERQKWKQNIAETLKVKKVPKRETCRHCK